MIKLEAKCKRGAPLKPGEGMGEYGNSGQSVSALRNQFNFERVNISSRLCNEWRETGNSAETKQKAVHFHDPNSAGWQAPETQVF
jgi:hypothetical protein